MGLRNTGIGRDFWIGVATAIVRGLFEKSTQKKTL
jgi:hypothetical protein